MIIYWLANSTLRRDQGLQFLLSPPDYTICIPFEWIAGLNARNIHIFVRWRRGVAVERRTRDREVVGSSLDRALRRKNSGQVSHT